MNNEKVVNEKNPKIRMMREEPIPQVLIKMGLPIIIGLLVTALYNLVDAYFVAGLGTKQMGAITVAFPIGQVMVGLGLLFGSGAGSYISRLLGKGDKEKANKVASTALYSSLLVSLVTAVVMIIFLNSLLLKLGATQGILPYAKEYATIFIAGSILNIINVTMTNIVISEGAAKITMIAMLSGALLNVCLDPLLIYNFNMGISGAAIATAISQAVSTVVFLAYILSRKSIFTFSIKRITMSKDIVGEILKVGVPTMIFQVLICIAIGLTNIVAKNYGDSAIAAMGAVTRIMSLGILIVFGFSKGFQPIAGYSYGSKNYGRLDEAIKTSVKWTSVFCVIFALILICIPNSIISLFSKNDLEVIDIGSKALRASGLTFIFFGFYTIYSSLFLALGKARKGGLLGISRQGIFFVPIILVLPSFMGLDGLIYAQPMADIFATITTVVMSIGVWKEIRKHQEVTA